MKQITQKELIKLIEEKQENATIEYELNSRDDGFRTLEESRARFVRQQKNKAYIDAYQDLICYLNSVELVPEEQECCVTKSRNLAEVYFRKNVTIYTYNQILGSRTPFEIVGKITSDNGEYVQLDTEDGSHAIITKNDIKNIEIVPERIEANKGCFVGGEEQIGCPLEARCKLYEEQEIYDTNGDMWRISRVEEHTFEVYKPSHSWNRANLSYSDYKKNWWLKPDKSE